MADQENRKRFIRPKSDMNSLGNCVLHGLYLGLYAFVKNLSFPFFNYLRYGVIRLFSRTVRATYVADGVLIVFPWRVRIGRNSSLNQGVIIDGFGGVNIGEGVRIAAYVTINTADHDFSDPGKCIMDQGYICGEVNIEDDVWIGSGVCINKGVTIGKGSVIGSGSVVTRDIPPYSVAAGVPCRVIKKRE
jgi:acetyltransferase-like isoleucine patch superfamily enzyme